MPHFAPHHAGLSPADAAQRIATGAVNDDGHHQRRTVGAIVVENVATPFNLVNLLLIGGLVAVWLWRNDDRLLLDSVGVGVVVLSNTILAIVQEVRASRALHASTITLDTKVTVRRGGADVETDRTTVVMDDLLVLGRGDAVVADGVVVATDGMEINAAIVTGESEATAMAVGDTVRAGSACVAGRGLVRVTGIGSNRLSSQITAAARRRILRSSPMQRRVMQLFEWSFAVAVVLAAADLVLAGGAIDDTDRLRRLATVVLGLVPEGLVFFSTTTLTLGVWRMRRRGIVVQKLAAVESFAGVDTVCMDKTGTLTENRLQVAAVVPIGVDAAAVRHALADYVGATADDGPLVDALRAAVPTATPRRVARRVPFSSARKYGAVAFDGDGTWLVLGAADVVAGAAQGDAIRRVIGAHGLAHHRLVVLARAAGADANGVTNATVIGLVAVADAPRNDAAAILATLAAAGIDVHIATGDGAGPVDALLASAGITLAADHRHVRCTPNDKQQLVRRLRAAGRHVAMVGDGVNDVPAIKEADVGIAMDKADGITRDAADIVLGKDGFAGFAPMVDEGRATIRTILNVSRLFLGKNAVLLCCAALVPTGLIGSVLTPRRGALLSVIGVGLPAILLAAAPPSTAAVRRFMPELLQSIAAITLAAVLSAVVSTRFVPSPAHPSTMVMMALLASLVTTSALVDTMSKAVRQRIVLAGGGMVGLWLVCGLFPMVPPLSVVAVFYEVDAIAIAHVPWALLHGATAAAITAAVHGAMRLRA